MPQISQYGSDASVVRDAKLGAGSPFEPLRAGKGGALNSFQKIRNR